MKTILALLCLTFLYYSCNNDDDSQEEEYQKLNTQYEAIIALTAEIPCTDASTWDFTAIGSRLCGGPDGYIAYPTTIDTEAFLQQVRAYTKARADFNEKWGGMGPCDVPSQPSGVKCENGVAVLVYGWP
ncbi:hypothetical protein [Formosa sp. A9]|uniref:hypothetical protein n=1 Tax=Formosa sp. A9 TaxID=3442641 RepID=UPI003EBB18E4